MITTDKIDEWIQEVEERPSSAPLIIRYISNRLRDLTSRNEELLAENIALRSGRKVEEYETRIGNLEYQLEMLKRQFGGDVEFLTAPPPVETLCLIAFLADGRVLRFESGLAELTSGSTLANIPLETFTQYMHPRLLLVSPTEELLFAFDSGRTVNMAVGEIPLAPENGASWSRALLVEPRGAEELAAVLPIARMSLYDFCVQYSRRGYLKKMMRASFEGHVGKNFIGSGVKQKPDRTAGLTLCAKDDLFVLASVEGWLTTRPVTDMSFTADETMRLSTTDHIVSGFSMGRKPSVIVVTHNGKVITRESNWLEIPASAKGRGQAVFSQSRREAGTRVIGAAAVDNADWAAALHRDGCVTAHTVTDLMAAGAVCGDKPSCDLLEFVLFHFPMPADRSEK